MSEVRALPPQLSFLGRATRSRAFILSVWPPEVAKEPVVLRPADREAALVALGRGLELLDDAGALSTAVTVLDPLLVSMMMSRLVQSADESHLMHLGPALEALDGGAA